MSGLMDAAINKVQEIDARIMKKVDGPGPSFYRDILRDPVLSVHRLAEELDSAKRGHGFDTLAVTEAMLDLGMIAAPVAGLMAPRGSIGALGGGKKAGRPQWMRDLVDALKKGASKDIKAGSVSSKRKGQLLDLGFKETPEGWTLPAEAVDGHLQKHIGHFGDEETWVDWLNSALHGSNSRLVREGDRVRLLTRQMQEPINKKVKVRGLTVAEDGTVITNTPLNRKGVEKKIKNVRSGGPTIPDKPGLPHIPSSDDSDGLAARSKISAVRADNKKISPDDDEVKAVLGTPGFMERGELVYGREYI